MEKNGKSVCTECAGRLKGIPYPLRPPTPNPLYASDAELKRALAIGAEKEKKQIPCPERSRGARDEKGSRSGPRRPAACPEPSRRAAGRHGRKEGGFQLSKDGEEIEP